MGDMTRHFKQALLVGGLILILYRVRARKMLDDDIEIPEFMHPRTCDEPGCMKRAIPMVG